MTCEQARSNEPTDSRFDLSEWFELPEPPNAIGLGLGSSDLIAVTTDCQGWFANSSGLLSALARHPTVSMERIALRSWHRVTRLFAVPPNTHIGSAEIFPGVWVHGSSDVLRLPPCGPLCDPSLDEFQWRLYSGPSEVDVASLPEWLHSLTLRYCRPP